MMDRRRFLAALLGGAVLDTDKLLWRPGAKLISIPAISLPVRPYPDIEAIMALLMPYRSELITIQNEAMLARAQCWELDPLWRQRPLKIGDTILVRPTERFRAC